MDWKTISLRGKTFPNRSTNFDAIPIEIPAGFLAEIHKLNLKFQWKCKGPRIGKAISKKESKMGELTHTTFKIYYTVTVIKTVWQP